MVTHAKPKRSLAKTATWRVCATVTTIVLVWIYFGNITAAISVGIIETIVKTIVYYLHERAWNKIGWGFYEAG